MPLRLHIDTAVENASICISKDGSLLLMAENKNQKDHAAWIQPAIQSMMKEAGHILNELDTIAVSNGPGSYTGLRVGLATAKGLCFALNIPLITLSTLEVMTLAATTDYEPALPAGRLPTTNFFCPMIDARRMEVFTGLYKNDLTIIQPPHARIIDENSFKVELNKNKILFFGTGAAKCSAIIQHPNARFETIEHNASHMIAIAEAKAKANDFADLAYAEPFYIKDFHTVPSKK